MPKRVSFMPDDDEEQHTLLGSRRRQRSPSSTIRRGAVAAAVGPPRSATSLGIVLGCFVVGLFLAVQWGMPTTAGSLSSGSPSPPSPPPPPPPPPAPPPLGPAPTVAVRPFGWVLNESMAWAQETVPHFECDDKDVTIAYWYRWRLFHLHMAKRPAGKHGCERPGSRTPDVDEAMVKKKFMRYADQTKAPIAACGEDAVTAGIEQSLASVAAAWAPMPS